MKAVQEFSNLFTPGEPKVVSLEMSFVLPTVSSGSSFPYVHVQSSPVDEWVVNHNLGYRPVIEVLSPGGIVVMADVVHTSVNQVRINFTSPQTGTVTAR